MIEIRVVDGAVEYRTKIGTFPLSRSGLMLKKEWSEWRKAEYFGRAFTPQQEHRLDGREKGAQLPPVADNPVITDGLLAQLGEARQLARARASEVAELVVENKKLTADNERQARELSWKTYYVDRLRTVLQRVRAQVAAAGGKTAELLDEIDVALKG